VDLDHTLSAAWPRDDLFGNWEAWNAASHEDEVIEDMMFLVHALRNYCSAKIIIFTARNERWRQKATEWLINRFVYADELLMRPVHDFSPDAECKYNMAIRRFGSEDSIRNNVVMILDDNESVIERFAQLGITALQVHARRA
jgi:hypothetical protein